MPYEIVITEREIETIERRLADLGDEIVRLRSSVESHQAKVRRMLFGYERDSGGANAKTSQRGCP